MSISWAQSPGEGWLDALYTSFQWMQIRPTYVREEPVPVSNPSAELPGAVGTNETCFREPDGWITCVFTDSVWADEKRSRGLPEVLPNAPEFIPPAVIENTRHEPPPVVSSDPQTGVSEDAGTVAITWEGAIGAIGDLYSSYTGAQSQVYNYVAGPTPSPAAIPPMYSTVSNGGSCGCNSNPCVCGSINGRPALVDPRTGKRCYKRRRRVMLTEGDFNTLLRIATLPNNSNVRTALAKAIGRR